MKTIDHRPGQKLREAIPGVERGVLGRDSITMRVVAAGTHATAACCIMDLHRPMSTISEIREDLESSPSCQFVSADVYIDRLTSHDAWIRADEPSANLLGLLDEKTGNRIFVRMEELTRRRDTSHWVN